MNKLFDIFNEAGFELYYVGGFVRDKVLGLTSADIDLATNAKPKQSIQVLKDNRLPVYVIGIEFGTVETIINEEQIQITTYRCEESYCKGNRKPSVKFGATIEEDLARRDFTINAMAMNAKDNIIDPFDGQSDLANKVIKTPISPDVSFTDDPLRMLRACRFVARGFGQIDETTKSAMQKHAHLISSSVSVERVFEETNKLLMTNDPVAGLKAMVETGIMAQIFPEVQELVEFRNNPGKYHHLPVWEHVLETVRNTPRISEVRWGALFHDISKPSTWSNDNGNIHYYGHHAEGSQVWGKVAHRLKTSNEFARHVSCLIYEHQNLRGEITEKAARRLIVRMPGDYLNNLVELCRADTLAHHPEVVDKSMNDLDKACNTIIKAQQSPRKPTGTLPSGTGNVVMKALGIKPGSEVGKIMIQLQQMMTDGEIDANADFAMLAQKIHKESK